MPVDFGLNVFFYFYNIQRFSQGNKFNYNPMRKPLPYFTVVLKSVQPKNSLEELRFGALLPGGAPVGLGVIFNDDVGGFGGNADLSHHFGDALDDLFFLSERPSFPPLDDYDRHNGPPWLEYLNTPDVKYYKYYQEINI